MSGASQRLPASAPPLPPGLDPALLDAAGHVAGDRPCVSCGYNLRTLPAAGVCPECATPVARSVQRDDVLFWLKNVTNGAGLLFSSGVALLAGITASVLPPLSLPDLDRVSTGVLMAVLAFAGLVGGTLLWLVGGVQLTERDPRELGRREGPTLRRLARWSYLALTALTVAGVLAVASGPRRVVSGPAAATVLGLLIAANFALLLGRGRQLARLLAEAPPVQRLTWALRMSLLPIGFCLLAWVARAAGLRIVGWCTAAMGISAAVALLLAASGFYRLYARLDELRSGAAHPIPRDPGEAA